MTDASLPRDDDAALAGEVALGLLTGEERAAALRRMLAEPDFAEEVDAWSLRLAPMLDDVASAPPANSLWPRIAAQAKGGASRAALRWWRTAAIVAGGLAAALALVVLFRAPATVPVATPPAPRVVLLAQLPDTAGRPVASLQIEAMSGQLRVRTDRLPQGAKVPELWVIGSDGKPYSLGLVALNAVGDYVLSPATVARLTDGATIAITLEPRDDRPHAAPTGSILGTARLTALGRVA